MNIISVAWMLAFCQKFLRVTGSFTFHNSALLSSARRDRAYAGVLSKMSGTNFSNDGGAADNADIEKWERMYSEGEMKKQDTIGFTELDSREFISDARKGSVMKSEVKVVTFDLDDTLWKTGAVIGHANQALQEHLDSCSLAQPRQVKDVMKELFGIDQVRYCPELATNPDSAKIEPVMLTQLRKDSIFDVCVKDNGFTDEEADLFSQKAFQVWTDARHAAIPAHLAGSVVECLSAIRGIQTSSGLPIIIGAITNGNYSAII